MNSLGWAPPGWEALKTPVTTVTQICKAKSPYSNSKIKFSKTLATSYPRGLYPRTVLLLGSFPAVQFGLRHIRKNIPPSSPLHWQNPRISLSAQWFWGNLALFSDQDLTYSSRVYKTSLRSHLQWHSSCLSIKLFLLWGQAWSLGAGGGTFLIPSCLRSTRY